MEREEGRTGCKFDKNPFYCRSFPDRVSISVRTTTTLVEAPKIRAKKVGYVLADGECINGETGAASGRDFEQSDLELRMRQKPLKKVCGLPSFLVYSKPPMPPRPLRIDLLSNRFNCPPLS